MSRGKKIFDDLRLLPEDEQVRLLARMSHEDLVTMWKYYSEICHFNEDHKIGDRLVSMMCHRYVDLVSDLGK